MTTFNLSLLDTNVLVYATDRSSPFHARCIQLRERGLSGEIQLCLSPQVLSEFYAVVTNSKRVRNPRTQQEALSEVEKYYRSKNIKKIYHGPAASEIMLDLLKRYEVKQHQVFDLQLVATMLANGVSRIYTFNQDHFIKFDEIEVLGP